MADSHTTERGIDLLRDPRLNKGTAFSIEQRRALGIEGLLPDVVSSHQTQLHRAELHLASMATDMERYVYFSDLQERNEDLFYRVLMHDPVKYMPIVYTPTVGAACQQYGRWYRRPKGLWVSRNHRGRIAEVLRNWHVTDVRFIVVTDGERILGLGDQGAQGMGIPIGKLALYTACAGVPPQMALPITLDVGTNNRELLDDPFYIGVRKERLTGEEYDSFLEEFVSAVQEVFPDATIQWEDFANQNAVPLLERYRNRVCSFNDDIQGTAAVGVAGILAALRLKGESLEDQRILFFGAGSAGIGIADLLTLVMVQDGLTIEEARKRCWLFDSKGLVQSSRSGLGDQKQRYAHDHAEVTDLAEAVRQLKATVIIGTSTIPRSFTCDVVQAMLANTPRPLIFPFSNPTSKAECTAEEAYTWTNGSVIFASGSPFDPVEVDGKRMHASQGNNVLIFPAMGLAVLAARPTHLPDEAFAVSARALAAMATEADFELGLIYPPLRTIRETQMDVAAAVATWLWDQGLAREERPSDIARYVRDLAWRPA
jgi:malate dehydrogenase (oxaloacetate-decarboxylating)(NADP+)